MSPQIQSPSESSTADIGRTTQLGSPFATGRWHGIIDLCTPPPSDAGGIDADDESDSFAPKINKTSAQGAFQTPPQTPTTAPPSAMARTTTISSTSTGKPAPSTPVSISISNEIQAITPTPSSSPSSKWATSPNERITVNHVYKPYARADRWLMTPGDDAATRSAVDPGMKPRIASITAAGGRGRWPVSESEDEHDELDSSDGEPDTTAGPFSSSTSHIPHRTNDLQCNNHSISQPRIDSRYCDQATQTENRNLWTVADFERRAAIAQTARELIGALQPLCKMSISETVEAAML